MRIRWQESATCNCRLDAQPLILLSSEFATREQIDRYCRLHRLEPDVRMEANSIGAVLSVIRSTTLATLLPAAIAGQFDDVVAIELRPALLQRTACLLQRQGAWQSAAARIHHPGPRERDND